MKKFTIDVVKDGKVWLAQIFDEYGDTIEEVSADATASDTPKQAVQRLLNQLDDKLYRV